MNGIKISLGKVKISKKYILQLFLIYLLLQYQGGTFYYTFNSIFRPIVFGIFMATLCFFYKSFRDKNLLIFTFIICTLISLISFINGNETGINIILEMIGTIIFTYIIVIIDEKNASTVYLKLLSFLAFISLIIFALVRINEKWILPLMIQSKGEKGDLFYGGIFYTIRYVWYYDLRNCGIFTEPGLYCIPLLVGMYILLFLGNELNITQKQKRKYFIILFCTVLSTMSTAGLISLGIILICYLMNKPKSNESKQNIKKYILFTILIGMIFLIVDYYANGTKSFLYTNVLMKMSSQQLKIEGNTGNARITTIILCIETLVHYPLGVGMTYITSRLPKYAVGAKFMIFISAYGIITATIFYIFILKNLFRKYNRNIWGVISFLACYIIMSSAQSMVFYPCFMLVILFYRKRKLSDV